MSNLIPMDASKVKEGSMGLSYQMLTKSNYTTWVLKMRVFMHGHGVWKAVKSNNQKSTIEDQSDKIALAVIYQGKHEEILLSLAEKKTAKDAYEVIRTMYQDAERVKKTGVLTLKAVFESLSMKYN